MRLLASFAVGRGVLRVLVVTLRPARFLLGIAVESPRPLSVTLWL